MARKQRSTEQPDAGGQADAFVRTGFRLATLVKRNPTSVVVGIAALAMIIMGTVYYVNYRTSTREVAGMELASIRLGATSPEAMIQELEDYVERFGGEFANEGRILLAHAYMDADRTVDAEQVARQVTAAPDEPLGFAARTLIATAQEASGDAELALATYQTLAEGARFPFQQREAQASAARILASLGRLEEAVSLYAAIAEEAEAADDPVEASVYRLRAGEIGGRLGDM